MRARALGQARVARRAAGAGAGQTRWGWAAWPGRPVQGRLSENTRICIFFIFCNFPFFCYFVLSLFFVIFFVNVLSFPDFLSFFCRFTTFCHVFLYFFVIFCRFFCHFLSRNLCHFLSLGQSFFCHFPKPLSFVCHWGSHFFFRSGISVIFVSFPEPLSFCQSFLVSPLPGPWLCQYVRIPGQTIQRPCLLLEG